VIYGYFEDLDPRGVHWHHAPGVSVGVIPTNDGRTCVFVALPERRFREELDRGIETLFRQVLREASGELAEAVADARRAGKLFPFPGARGFLLRAFGPGWALVGDAGFFRDPITAHGITDALRDAELLVRAVLRGSAPALAEYQRTRDEIARGMLEISDEIASFEWDLERAKVLHLDLSRQMNAEVELLRGLDPAGEKTTRVCPVSRAGYAFPNQRCKRSASKRRLAVACAGEIEAMATFGSGVAKNSPCTRPAAAFPVSMKQYPRPSNGTGRG
jgi:hypothetical protein